MPGAALEHWSLINCVPAEVLAQDVSRWGLPDPLSGFKKREMAMSFSGLRTKVEEVALRGLTPEEMRSLGRAAQIVAFEHVAKKTLLGIQATLGEGTNTLVVSGGVASNTAFRKMYLPPRRQLM
jgi:tRNA A37 threonylcarbamoyltransferase TsaD